MNKFFIIGVFFTFIFTQVGPESSPINLFDPDFIKFMDAYRHIRRWEGNYSYLKYDKGGETYGGIARRFNKNWSGWDVLDEFKKDSTVHWNKHIPELEKHVINYYYSIWKSEGFNLIKQSTIANYIFDYRNAGPISIKHIQEVLSLHGYKVTITGKMNKQTISAINKINPIVFILHLRELRKRYYQGVVSRKPQMGIYLRGWMNRANAITDVGVSNS